MNIKMLKKQIAKGEWEYVEIDIDDAAAVEALRLHNKEVNYKIYEEKKLLSKFSIEEIQIKIGHEFADEVLDPLQKLIEDEEGNFYDDREEVFEKGLSMLGQALETLTSRQKLVFETVVYGKSRRDLAGELGISHTAINKTYNQALSKLKKFFLAYPEFIAYFPKLNQL